MSGGVKEVSAEYRSAQEDEECPKGYKRTEVGVIPRDWSVGELVKFWSVTDCKHITARFVDSGYPVASIQEVQNRYVDLSNAKQTTPEFFKVLTEGKRKLESGDLILSRNATVGEVAQVKEWHPAFAMGQDVCLLRKKSKNYSTDYLQELFSSGFIRKQLDDCMVGTTFKRINVAQVKALMVQVPGAEEQTAIANALSDVDALITSLQRLITKKRAIKTAAMQQLLTGKKRLPPFCAGTHLSGDAMDGEEPVDKTHTGYKQTELGEIPDDWEVSELGQLAKIQRGASPRPIDSPIWFESSSQVGWLRISDITNAKKYLIDTVQNLSQAGIKNSRYVSSGNLVMSICATVGRPILTRKNVCIHDGFVVFNDLSIDTEYLYYILTELEHSWIKHGQTGSQMNLNTGLINSTSILVSSQLEEQKSIARVLAEMDDDIAALEQRLTKSQQLKQGMMQELLTGKTRLV